MTQAEHLLNSLWASMHQLLTNPFNILIIHKTLQKIVKTQAGTAVSELNAKIAHYSTVYRHCCSAMQRLGAQSRPAQPIQGLGL